ncbi:MAG: dihydrodipicolinate synthase family protein, partial [Mesorhizobium sp.]
ADPLAMTDPWSHPAVDWERTMAFRHHLWRLGFRIAEAMDTAQRGMGFDWTNARELIRRSTAEARTVDGADLASGAGTDHLAPGTVRTLDDVIAAYEE